MMTKIVKTKIGIIRQGMENKAERFIFTQYISLVQTPHENLTTDQNNGTGGMSRKSYQERPQKGLGFLSLQKNF